MSNAGFDIDPLLPALETGQLILVPNQRTREAILDAWAQHAAKPVWRWPKVEAIDIWLRDQWTYCASRGLEPFCSLRPMDTTEEMLIWLKLVEDSLDNIPLLDPEETAASLSRSYQLSRQWLINDADFALLQNYSGIPDVAAFLRWMSRFQSHCQRHQLVSLVDLARLLLAGTDALNLGTQVTLVNFFQPPPLYRALFDKLASHTGVMQIECNIDHQSTVERRYEFADQEAEIRACIQWAAAVGKTSPNAQIAVICPGSEEQLRSIVRMFDESLPGSLSLDLMQAGAAINVAAGTRDSLLQSALISTALGILNLDTEQQDSRALCTLLQSPYLLAADTEFEARLQLQLYLRRNGNSYCNLTRLGSEMNRSDRPWYSPLLAQLLLDLRSRSRTGPRSRTPREWTTLFGELLTIAGWPGNAVNGTEQQALEKWHKLLDMVAGYGDTLGSITREVMLARLRTACGHMQVDSRHDPQCRVTLYTPEQVAGLPVSHAWIMGMSDQVWPPAAVPDPFIPFELQRRFAIPGSHASLQQAYGERLITLIRRGTSQELVCSHSRFVEDRELRPAACFAHLAAETWPLSLTQERHSTGLPNTPSLEQFADLESVPPQIPETLLGDSALPGTQSSCPFQAFSRYRLQARPLDEFSSGLSPAARGIAVHKTLEYFWTQVSSSAQLLAMSAEEQGQLLETSVKEAVRHLHYQYPEIMTPAFQQLEQQRLLELVSRFLDEERQRHPFQVLHLEQNLSWQHGPLKLSLKSDRIDLLADGSLALLDYKTGKQIVKPARWLDAQPLDLQLPLYHYAVTTSQSKPVSAVVVAQLNVDNTGYQGFWEGEHFHDSASTLKLEDTGAGDWATVQQQWQASIDRLADAFIRGECVVAPVHRLRSCQHCGLQGLCRITELDQSIPDEDVS